MSSDLKSLATALFLHHWTVEEKALIGCLGVFAGVKLIAEIGVPKIDLTRLLSNPFRKKKGIRIGKFILTDSDRVRHSHIIGPPGSGKTELTKLLCFDDIQRGRGCFIMDPKGDRELFDEVKAYCKKVNREKDLYLLSATYPEESSIWNPCGLGNASELQSKFLNANIYSQPHFAKACELALIEAFNELTLKKPSGFRISDLVRELKHLASKQKSSDLDGLFYDFGSLVLSEWAPILCMTKDQDPAKEISLLDVVQKNKILFVHLPTEGKSIQSSRIGRLLTQELILISGLKKSYPDLNRSGVFSVFIDEFDAFATDSFVTFLNKGRSSNFMIHIAHQTLSDLKKINPEFAGQILGNCNIHAIFRTDDPDEAEFWARFVGTRTVTKTTYQTQDGAKTGTSSNRESQEFEVSPNEIKQLGVGQCILSVKTQKINHRVKLPLPPRLITGDPTSSTHALGKKIRGFQCPDFEKTSAETEAEIQLEQLEEQPKRPHKKPSSRAQPNREHIEEQKRWKDILQRNNQNPEGGSNE